MDIRLFSFFLGILAPIDVGEVVENLRRVGLALYKQSRGADNPAMLEAHRLFKLKSPLRGAARNLEMLWDGIGLRRG